MLNGLTTSLVFVLSFFVKIEADGNGTCQIERLSEQLGTNKYLLYGLTADCQLFFATSIPDGIDLGKLFGPQPIVSHFPHQVDCRSARLYPIRNANNKLKLLLVFKAGTQIYASVFDFKVPEKDKWFSLITGPDNGPVVMQCPDGKDCTFANFTSLIDQPAQAQEDQILAFITKTGNQFALFYRILNGQTQKDMNVYTMAANDTLTRSEIITNILSKPVQALIMDPYANNIYFFDYYFSYQYPLNQMSFFNELNNYESKAKMSILYDGHSFNYHVVNNVLFRLQFASSNQANITTQTIPTLLNTTQYALAGIPSNCIGQLLRPNDQDYNSVENFQMSVLLQQDYDAVIGPVQNSNNMGNTSTPPRSGVSDLYSFKLLTAFALTVLYQV
uniref:Transmembrane protein n=1 Tax=Plectus sambesii TaxID=2011161 RepID=A0A914VTV8_9BILA